MPPLLGPNPIESGWSWTFGSSLLSGLQGCTSLQGRMRPEGRLLPTLVADQFLGLVHPAEQLRIQQFILGAGVEQLCKADPGSNLAVPVPLISLQRSSAWAMNTGLLSLRMNAGTV